MSLKAVTEENNRLKKEWNDAETEYDYLQREKKRANEVIDALLISGQALMKEYTQLEKQSEEDDKLYQKMLADLEWADPHLKKYEGMSQELKLYEPKIAQKKKELEASSTSLSECQGKVANGEEVLKFMEENNRKCDLSIQYKKKELADHKKELTTSYQPKLKKCQEDLAKAQMFQPPPPPPQQQMFPPPPPIRRETIPPPPPPPVPVKSKLTRRTKPLSSRKTRTPKSKKTPRTPKWIIRQFARRHLNKDKVRLLYLKGICGDVGICLSLNFNTKKIFDVFEDFKDFTYLTVSPGVISSSSANGVVRSLEYKKTIEGVTFNSYCVFKSSLSKDADNLLYEYAVGHLLVNELCKYFPIFVPTYGAYLNTQGVNFAVRGKISARTFTNSLTPLDYPKNIRELCTRSKDLCVVGQFYNNFMTLNNYMKKASAQDIADLPFILFQVYFALYQCKDKFTHYDLHYENVGVVRLPENTHIEYEYDISQVAGSGTVIRFKSKYLVKLIDYGKCYFNNGTFSSSKLVDQLHQNQLQIVNGRRVSVNTGCPYDLTMVGIFKAPSDYMDVSVNNQSHDLRVLTMIRDGNIFSKILNNIRGFAKILQMVQYTRYYGTPSVVHNPLDRNVNSKIYNIRDVFYRMTDYLINNTDRIIESNESGYSGSVSIGRLQVFKNMDLTKPMVFTRSVRMKEKGDKSRFEQPDVPNVDLNPRPPLKKTIYQPPPPPKKTIYQPPPQQQNQTIYQQPPMQNFGWWWR